MKLLELFEPNSKSKVGSNSAEMYEESKQIGDFTISFQARNEGRNQWEVFFIAIDKEGNSSWEPTGSGDEVKVFSFVVNAMRNFIKARDPRRFNFSSKKVEGSRASLYRKFVERFLKDKYIAQEYEIGLGRAEKYIQFDLLKKPND